MALALSRARSEFLILIANEQSMSSDSGLESHAHAQALSMPGALYFVQKAYWFDYGEDGALGLPASTLTRTVERFKDAFQKYARDTARESEEYVDAISEVFEFGPVFGAPVERPSGDRTRDRALEVKYARAGALSTCIRLGITSLKTSQIAQVKEAADALKKLVYKDGKSVAKNFLLDMDDNQPNVKSVDGALELLGRNRPKYFGLEVAMNVPKYCDAYVYSTTSNEVVAWQRTLDLDFDKLRTAMTAKSVDETRGTFKFFNMCFACAAPALSKHVTLHVCKGCRCMAYCGDDCYERDYYNAHSQECKRQHLGISRETNIQVYPARQTLGTRFLTEISKRASVKAALASSNNIRIRLVANGVDGTPAPVEYGWQFTVL